MTTQKRTPAVEDIYRVKDPVTREVVNERLHAIAGEMQTVLFRSAFSSIIKEALDASAALFDLNGDTLAQASALPGHLGMMISGVKRIITEFPPETMKPGDVYCFNEVYDGGTHLPDITVLVPIFWDGKVVAYSASLAHHQDVGGSAPGSTPPNATEIFAEGLRLPAVKLCENDQPVPDIWKILALNSRIPDVFLGDIRAQIAVGSIGRRRIKELFDEYPGEMLLDVFADLLDYAESLARSAIQQIPDGDYTFEDYVDHDGVELDRPLKIRATVSIRGDDVTIDFTGTDNQALGPVNSVPASTASAVFYVVRSLVGANAPNNQGCYRPIQIIAPPGTLVNPDPPAPVGLRTYVVKRLVDVMLGAMAQAIPDRMPAASHGQVCVMYIGGKNSKTGKPFVGFIGVPFAGGMGGRPVKDGIDMIETDVNNCMNFPIEACETEYPIQFDYLHLWQDSGGAGRFRGGLGYEASVRWLGEKVVLSHRRDRHNFKPWGLYGGDSSPTCRTILTRADGTEKDLPSKILTYLDKGDQLNVFTTGGGGYGNPLQRDPQAVLDDVLDGRVSIESAESVYGVVLSGDGKSIDIPATKDLRSRLLAG